METQAQDISNVPINNDFKVGKFHGLNCVNSNFLNYVNLIPKQQNLFLGNRHIAS